MKIGDIVVCTFCPRYECIGQILDLYSEGYWGIAVIKQKLKEELRLPDTRGCYVRQIYLKALLTIEELLTI